MKNNKHIQQILDFNEQLIDRRKLHKAVEPILERMAKDPDFWNDVIRMNLTDRGFTEKQWSMYEIPYLYVYETADFFIKVHLFPALESKETDVLASAIHHHNNYLLTTYAAFGSGYETFLFEKLQETDNDPENTPLKIKERFKQSERRLHLVDSWQPHAVINPESFSATLVFWSPDKKRSTDKLRSNPMLKAIKQPLRKLIYLFRLDRSVGIAAQNTYQWYPKNGRFVGVLEEDFFAPTKAQVGEIVNNYSIQGIFHFIQNIGFSDTTFLRDLIKNKMVPNYFDKYIEMLLRNEPIPEIYAKASINVPGGRVTINDVIEASNKV